MCEQSIIGARASVMMYDDSQKKWIPSGSSSGLSKVQIYHHQQNNTFRIVGRKLQDHEVVINCSILKGLKYNQATATFHQWRDSKYVYGLNFSSPQDAEAFARAMSHTLDILCGRIMPPLVPPSPNGITYEEDMGYRTMTREDAAIIQQQQIVTVNGTSSASNAQTPTSQQANQNIPPSPPSLNQGHHRTSSAPPAPQPPPISMPALGYGNQQQQQQQPSTIPSQNHQHQQQQQQQYHQSLQQQHQEQLQQTQQQQQQPSHQNIYSTQLSQGAGTGSGGNSSGVIPSYGSNQQQITSSHVHIPPPPPPPQAPSTSITHNQNGSIYVASSNNTTNKNTGIPSSTSNNSVYSSNQQLQLHQPTQVATAIPPVPPPLPQASSNYGQTNGISSHQQPPLQPLQPIPTQMPSQLMNGGQTSVVAAPPPPPPAFNNANVVFMNGSGIMPQQQPQMIPPCPPPMFGAGAGGAGPGISIPSSTSTSSSLSSSVPPPPPLPPMGGLINRSGEGMDMSSLAAQLQQAKLKRKNAQQPPPPPPATENSGSSTSSGGSANYGTIGRSSTGMASMMDEMAKTLARRRALTDKIPEPENNDEMMSSKQRPWEKSNTLPHKLGNQSNTNNNNNQNNNNNTINNNNINGGGGSGGGGQITNPESPRPSRKRFGSASEETILRQVNGGDTLSIATPHELEQIKADIIREIRIEIVKVKQEILDAIKIEFNRR